MRTLIVKKGQACLITDRLTREYLTGADVAEGYLLYSQNPVYFTDMRYFGAAKDKLAKVGVTAKPFISFESVLKELKAQKIKKILVDYTKTTLSEYAEYKKICPRIGDCSAKLTALRRIKTAEELSLISRACLITQNAVEKAFAFLKEGVTEIQVKEYLEDQMLKGGATGIAFDTIVAFGKNSAVPHHETGDTKLENNVAVLIDTGCEINGYKSDMTRTAFFGTPDTEFITAYNAVLSANETAEKGITGGMSGKSADGLARNSLKAAGYGEYFTHSLGHGVGLEIHEHPVLSPKREEDIPEGAVFTVEPGVYLDGKFGIRIEDTCVLKNGKAQRLFSDGKELKIFPEK